MHVGAVHPLHVYRLTRTIPATNATPCRVMRLNRLHRLSGVLAAVIANRLGYPAVVTDERGRTGYAAGQGEQGRQHP